MGIGTRCIYWGLHRYKLSHYVQCVCALVGCLCYRLPSDWPWLLEAGGTVASSRRGDHTCLEPALWQMDRGLDKETKNTCRKCHGCINVHMGNEYVNSKWVLVNTAYNYAKQKQNKKKSSKRNKMSQEYTLNDRKPQCMQISYWMLRFIGVFCNRYVWNKVNIIHHLKDTVPKTLCGYILLWRSFYSAEREALFQAEVTYRAWNTNILWHRTFGPLAKCLL